MNLMIARCVAILMFTGPGHESRGSEFMMTDIREALFLNSNSGMLYLLVVV